MTHKRSDLSDALRQMALSRWDNEGGAAPDGHQGGVSSGATQSEIPPLTNVELVQLRIRVIALENLVITLLAEASDRQLERIREMASYISPRPGSAHHPLTVHAAAQMLNLLDRARHFSGTTLT